MIKHLLLSLILLISFQNFLQAQLGVDHWETTVFAEDTWAYRLGTSEPPIAWIQNGFDDSNWSTGMGGFGYGDGDDNTNIPPSLSLYIRIDFDLTDLAAIEMAVLHADYDDAFVAYINGQEFARGNFGDTGTRPAFNELPPTDHEAALYNGGSSNFFFSLGLNDTSNNYEPTPPWFYPPFLSTNLPLIRINTNEQGIPDEPKIVADMKVIDNGPGNLNFVNDIPNNYDGKIAIEIRGASSQSFPKKNFGFETQDALGENNNVSLLGMPEENDWILHGPFSDKSLIRNALSFDLGRQMMDYASRTRFCELMIDDDYQGLYLLMERIKRDTFRVDIAKLNPDDIEGDELTGGYVFQLDRDDFDTEEDGWYSPHGSHPFYAYHHPDYEDLLPVQKDYLENWMTNFEAAMLQPNYANTYMDYIDEASFIDYFLINELTKHVDAFKLSFYMHKKKDSNGGKLHMGPIWDFNLGYNNFNFECDPEPIGWIYPCTSRAFWLNKILDIPAVQDQVYCRWLDLRASILDIDILNTNIDEMTNEISEAQVRNFSRWNILGTEVWPNVFVGDSHNEEVMFLRNWLTQRIAWMDANMLGNGADCTTAIASGDFGGLQVTTSPNPFNDQLTFSFENSIAQKGQLSISDTQGKMLLEYQIQTDKPFTLNTASLASGIYFYQLKNANGQINIGKIIKQ